MNSSPPQRQAGRTQYGPYGPYDLAQDEIAVVVSVGIVHVLEVVEVEEDD